MTAAPIRFHTSPIPNHPPRAAEFPFLLLDAGYVIGEHDHHNKCGIGNAITLLYTVSGMGRLIGCGEQVDLPPQSCCLIGCRDCEDCQTASSDEPWTYYYVHFAGEGLGAYAPYLLDKPRCLFPGKPKRLTELLQLLQKKGQDCPLLTRSRYSLMIAELMDTLLESRYGCAAQPQPKNREALTPAFEYIRKNYAQALTVEDLARECCLSKYYFLRLFKEASGESPYQYLTRYRVDSAKLLLADTSLSITDIASRVGYTNYGNFLTHFKKLMDMPPAQYRSMILAQQHRADAQAD